MPFVYKSLGKIEFKELLKEIRSCELHIASIKYDFEYALYLGHPKQLLVEYGREIAEYKNYRLELITELENRKK